MSRKRIVAFGAATVAVLGAGVATPYAMAQASTSATHFTVYAHGHTDKSIDVGRSGFSAGDYDVNTAQLRMSGAKVGWEVGNCLTARVGRTTADQLCTFVLHLRHGQLTALGVVRAGQQGPGTFAVPITGGTGRYAGAGGTLTITATSGSVVPMTVSLTG